MITIVDSDVKFDPNTFTPQLHVHFTVDLVVVGEGIDKPEDDLAGIIGNEVIRQARVWYSLTRTEGEWHAVV